MKQAAVRPFSTKAVREACGDPRPSIAARHANFLDCYYKMSKAINDMVAGWFLLFEEAGTAMNRMLNAGFVT